jgi:hypothetical protein
MNFKFNADGTTETLNTPESNKFILKFGGMLFSGDSTVVTERINHITMFAGIHDTEGHLCQVCMLKKKSFVEVINEANLKDPLMILICEDCISKLVVVLENIKQVSTGTSANENQEPA